MKAKWTKILIPVFLIFLIFILSGQAIADISSTSVTKIDVATYSLEPPSHRVNLIMLSIEGEKRLVFNWDKSLYFAYVGDGQSMYPLMGKDAILVLSKETDIKVGDVIVYQSRVAGQGLVCHRVVEVKQYEKSVGYICKGLNNRKIDFAEIALEDIYGVVIGILW